MRLYKFGENYGPFECEVEENGKPCGRFTHTIRLSMYENNALITECGHYTGPQASNFIIRNAMGIAVCDKHTR